MCVEYSVTNVLRPYIPRPVFCKWEICQDVLVNWEQRIWWVLKVLLQILNGSEYCLIAGLWFFSSINENLYNVLRRTWTGYDENTKFYEAGHDWWTTNCMNYWSQYWWFKTFLWKDFYSEEQWHRDTDSNIFKIVTFLDILKFANMLKGRFVLLINSKGAQLEAKTKETFILQGYTEIE